MLFIEWMCVSLRNEEKVERFFKWLLHIFLLFPENWTHLFMMPQSWNIWWHKMKNVNCSQLELGLPWQGMELPFPEILSTSTTSTEKSWTTVKMVNNRNFRQIIKLFLSKCLCCQINLGYLINCKESLKGLFNRKCTISVEIEWENCHPFLCVSRFFSIFLSNAYLYLLFASNTFR